MYSYSETLLQNHNNETSVPELTKYSKAGNFNRRQIGNSPSDSHGLGDGDEVGHSRDVTVDSGAQNRSRKGGGDPSKSRELIEVWGGAPGGGSPSRGELESIVTAS